MNEVDLLESLAIIGELDDRAAAADNFYCYCRYMIPDFYTPEKGYLEDIADALQLVEQGVIMKLMISEPPRSGKSLTVSLFVSWFIGKHPEKTNMRNAYADTLARTFSRHIRAFIEHPKYTDVFPDIKVQHDHSDLSDWAIRGQHSTYYCAGVGGAITGKGCNGVAILDDPIKNIAEALSETVLENIWQWYTSTHKSRMEKGCPEIQIATRWSRRDVIGRLSEEEKTVDYATFIEDPAKYPDHWVTFLVPALDEDGETFCDEIKTTKEYLQIKKLLDEFIWEAEFQQQPIEAKGLLFPEKDLMRFKMSELQLQDGQIRRDTSAAWVDVADEGSDYLCMPIGYVIGSKCYVVDVLFTREPVEVTEGMVSQKVIEHHLKRTTIESNFGGKQYGRNVKKIVREAGGKNFINWVPNSVNKETRILVASGIVKDQFVFRSDYEVGSEYDRFMKNLTSYLRMGKNEHDDAPDAITGLSDLVFHKKEFKVIKR